MTNEYMRNSNTLKTTPNLKTNEIIIEPMSNNHFLQIQPKYSKIHPFLRQAHLMKDICEEEEWRVA